MQQSKEVFLCDPNDHTNRVFFNRRPFMVNDPSPLDVAAFVSEFYREAWSAGFVCTLHEGVND